MSRRSMGKLPHQRPQRLSSMGEAGGVGVGNFQTPMNSSKKSKSNARVSNIPRGTFTQPHSSQPLKTKNSSAVGGGHASSKPHSHLNPPASLSRPKNLAANWTPQRLSNITGHMNRFSIGSNRGSMIGAKTSKDTRNLHDKTWQTQAIRELLSFLHQYEGFNSLKQSDFPLNSTNFKSVFLFLMSFLQPDYNLPKSKIELELPQQIKALGYPHQISKSIFQTLGSMHSWPTVLGILDFLRVLAVYMGSKPPEKLLFPLDDSEDFSINDAPSNDQILLKYQCMAYNSFTRGAEEFHDEFRAYESELIKKYGINMEEVKRLKHKKDELHEILYQLKNEPNKCVETRKKLEATTKDYETLKKYLDDNVAYLHRKEKELSDKKNLIKELEEGKEAMMSVVEQSRRQVKELALETGLSECFGIGDEVDPKVVHIQALSYEKKISQLKEEIDEVSQSTYAKQMKLQKSLENWDSLIRSYNAHLSSLDLDPDQKSRLTMDRQSVPREMLRPLQDLCNQFNNNLHELKAQVEQQNASNVKLSTLLKSKMKELSKLENDHQNLTSKYKSLEDKSEEEENYLVEKLEKLKAEFEDLKNKENSNLDDLKKQAEDEEQKVETLKKTIEEDFMTKYNFIMKQAQISEENFNNDKEKVEKFMSDVNLSARRMIAENRAMTKNVRQYTENLKEVKKMLEES